jgi:hypothetical protein
MMYATARVPPASKTTVAIETLAIVFELGRKSCAIVPTQEDCDAEEIISLIFVPRRKRFFMFNGGLSSGAAKLPTPQVVGSGFSMDLAAV